VTHRETLSQPAPAQLTPLQLLGTTLRQYRKQRRLSQPALAARTGIHHTYISEIEHGLHNISVLMLLRLAHALELRAAGLLAPLDPHAPTATCASRPARGAQETGVTRDVMPAQPRGDADELLHLLGASLRQARQQGHLSQTALATRTGLSATYIGEIEQGQRNLSVLSLLRLADALGLAVAQVLAPLEIRQPPSLPLIP
jgi:transcriptional regulator with XRE-family HTH domain